MDYCLLDFEYGCHRINLSALQPNLTIFRLSIPKWKTKIPKSNTHPNNNHINNNNNWNHTANYNSPTSSILANIIIYILIRQTLKGINKTMLQNK